MRATTKQLRGVLLRSVSRSFYLSIRFLPAKLRDPIALAYLLARATDTIADTAELEPAERMSHLETLADLIQGQGDRNVARTLIVVVFAPLQKNTAERTLIEQLPNCLQWLDLMATEDRADIREVLAKINEGQILDVEQFGSSATVTALKTAADLDRYTYLVAGCVGEFWTAICSRHLPEFSKQSGQYMKTLAVEYGKGLQLINVLRDIGADLQAGRCYLPADELHSLGITPADLRQKAALAQPVFEQWRQRAETGISAGVDYACAIQPWRVRLATVLPALIGARTLALLRDAGSEAIAQRVKVPRAEVHRILFACTTRLASPGAIQQLFARLSA